MDINILIFFLSFLPNFKINLFKKHIPNKNILIQKEKYERYINFKQIKDYIKTIKIKFLSYNPKFFMINNNPTKCSDFNYKGVACEIFNIDQNMKDNYKYTNNLINISRIKKANDYVNPEFSKKFIKILKFIILFIFKIFCYIFKKYYYFKNCLLS